MSYVISLNAVHDLEKRMLNCSHCGTALKQWEPQIGLSWGAERMATPFKWCTNYCCVVFKNLAILLGIPEADAEAYLVAQLPKVSR